MAIAKVLPQAVHGHDLAFDAHALRAMAMRNITEEEVIQVLEDPDADNLPADPPRKRCRKFFHQGMLRIDVVYEEEVTRLVVVTTWRHETGVEQ